MRAARLLIALAVAPLALAAQAAPPSPPCAAPAFREFDFWVGDWDVTRPDGARAGENTITTVLNDCVVHEDWRGARGGRGRSLSMYDATVGRWRQLWVADDGTTLLLEGGLDHGRMVLEGSHRAARDSTITVLERVTWTPLDADHVRQLWEQSTDGGATWRVVFDGRYARRPRTRP